MKTRLLTTGITILAFVLAVQFAYAGGVTNNGWYGGREIYYIDQGLEKNVQGRKVSDIFLIGGNRMYQANVVETIPGVTGYSPHWDVNIVHSAPGYTVQSIIDAGLASSRFATEGVLFDDAESILEAERRGLVTIVEPGLVVLCPIFSEAAADAPGHMQASEDFLRLTGSSTF